MSERPGGIDRTPDPARRFPAPAQAPNERIGPAPIRSFAFDDEHAPLYTVGQVCDMLDIQPAFLRRLDAEDIVSPARSEGRHRRYSRQQILDVEHVLSLTGDGLSLAGVRRVLLLEAEVNALRQQIEEMNQQNGLA